MVLHKDLEPWPGIAFYQWEKGISALSKCFNHVLLSHDILQRHSKVASAVEMFVCVAVLASFSP